MSQVRGEAFGAAAIDVLGACEWGAEIGGGCGVPVVSWGDVQDAGFVREELSASGDAHLGFAVPRDQDKIV